MKNLKMEKHHEDEIKMFEEDDDLCHKMKEDCNVEGNSDGEDSEDECPSLSDSSEEEDEDTKQRKEEEEEEKRMKRQVNKHINKQKKEQKRRRLKKGEAALHNRQKRLLKGDIKGSLKYGF